MQNLKCKSQSSTDGYKIGYRDLTEDGKIETLGGPGMLATLTLTKSCSSTVSPGGTVTCTIGYSNRDGVDLTEVVVTETYP